MNKHFYLPRKDTDLVIWLNNFSSKLKNQYAAVFGISSSDADKVVGFAAFFSFLTDYLEKLNTFSQALTAYKNNFRDARTPVALEAVRQLSITVPPGIPATTGMLKIIRKMVKTIKAHADYTAASGEDLGIEGALFHFDAAQYKPKGNAKAKMGFVEIGFTKKGVEAMDVYAGGEGANEWIFLGRKTQSPAHDARPAAVPGKPEKRRYCLRGIIADKEIGLLSDVMTVVVEG